MKKLITLIFAVLFYQNAKTQIIAGSTVGVYTDIEPDTLLYSTYFSTTHSYSIDINQDGVNDIVITTAHEPAGGQLPDGGWIDYYPTRYVRAISLNNDVVSFAFLKKVNDFYDVLNPYNAGNTIATNTYVASGYLAYYYLVSPIISEWIDTTDHYIGVRYTTPHDTAYGWIRARVGNYFAVIIKDFALEKFITVGVSEGENQNNKLKIYPNPASEILNVDISTSLNVTENLFVSIIDIYGREVIDNKQLAIKNGSAEINVKNLSKGIYVLRVSNQSREILYQQKLVKE